MDLGHDRVRGAGRDRGDRVWNLFCRCFSGTESARSFARNCHDLHGGSAPRPPARERFSKRLHDLEDRAHPRHRRCRILREVLAVDFISAGERRRRLNHERAIRRQPLLGDVRLLTWPRTPRSSAPLPPPRWRANNRSRSSPAPTSLADRAPGSPGFSFVWA